MRVLILLMSSMLVMVATAMALPSIVEANNYDELSDEFCAADHSMEHIFAFPAAIYDSHEKIECESGTFGLRVAEPKEDPGHKVYNIDPPHGVDNALDCDGKADTGMTVIALNCYPVSKEAVTHTKS